MNDALRELYQETIMGHNKKPRNFRAMDGADAQANGHNPLCGDRLTVFIALDEGTVADVSFVGDGCAISKSSASMMTESLKGLSQAEAENMATEFQKLIMREGDVDEALLGKLKVFAGVGEFPARVKCAALPWRTLQAALHDERQASTE